MKWIRLLTVLALVSVMFPAAITNANADEPWIAKMLVEKDTVLYETMGTYSKQLGAISAGQLVEVYERRGNWYLIDTYAGKSWISAPNAHYQISVFVDGQYQSYEQEPVNLGGSILVPLRELFESVGAKVEWNAANQTVTAALHDKSIELQIDNAAAKVNGQVQYLDAMPTIYNGYTMVPLRFVGEALNYYVVWDSTLQRVTMRTDLPLYGKTKRQVKEKYELYKPAYSESPYLEKPVGTAPFAPGKLNPGFLQDGLNMANMVRYLADLPDDLELDEALNNKAQHGAVLVYRHGSLSHTPPKPSDMSDEFYKIGYASTSSSNLSQGRSELELNVLGYMNDGDSRNIDRIGHRRWILNPSLKKIGFGYYESFGAMQVFDHSRKERIDYEYTAYPKGVFPMELFSNSHPWHVTLNPEKYEQPKEESVQIRIKRLSDNQEWLINNGYEQTGLNYFHVDTGGYGVNNAIIFRVDIAQKLEGKFEVTVTGIKDKSGNEATIQYVADFFNMNGSR